MSSQPQFCPRAVENGGGPGSPMKAPFNGEMEWRADRTCSYCGSLDPDVFMRRLEAGDVMLTPTDKSYKVYVENCGGEPFKQTFREGCPASPCPDIVGPDGQIDVRKCTHYVTREAPSGAKFYFQHLSVEQRTRFIELYNQRRLKLHIPGYFYVLPFFCQLAPPKPTPMVDDGA